MSVKQELGVALTEIMATTIWLAERIVAPFIEYLPIFFVNNLNRF